MEVMQEVEQQPKKKKKRCCLNSGGDGNDKKSMGRSGTYFGNRTNAVASELADSERK